MPTDKLSDEQQLEAVLDALADSIESASDAELLEDEIAAGRDPAVIDAEVRRLLLAACRKAKEREVRGRC